MLESKWLKAAAYWRMKFKDFGGVSGKICLNVGEMRQGSLHTSCFLLFVLLLLCTITPLEVLSIASHLHMLKEHEPHIILYEDAPRLAALSFLHAGPPATGGWSPHPGYL